MIGYDLDGTICDSTPSRNKPYFRQTGEERTAHDELRLQHYRYAELVMRPEEDEFVIITGRGEKYRQPTAAWLLENDIVPQHLEMMSLSRSRQNMIKHKLAACRKHDVKRYYEDDPKIARALAAEGITVVLIEHKD